MSQAAVHARPSKDRASLYEEITDKIVAELETGRLPWVQPWGTSAAQAPLSMPKNAATQRRYPALLDRLVTGKLQAEAEALRDEGWKWIAVATDFPYGHSAGLRRLAGETTELTQEEAATFAALQTEYQTLEAEYAGADDLPEAIDQRLAEIEGAKSVFENRPVRFDAAEIARAGSFVSIDGDGALRVERGFVRPEDEAPVEPIPPRPDEAPELASTEIPVQPAVVTVGGAPTGSETDDPEEDDIIRPLSDRLVTELTAHRTLALRDGVANDPRVAFVAVLHALCLAAFHRYTIPSARRSAQPTATVGRRGADAGRSAGPV